MAEKTFGTLRRLKIHLLSTMEQGRSSHLAILSSHKGITSELNLHDMTNIFINKNPVSKNVFSSK